MAKCETPGNILDCGEGHGCYIISDAETQEVLAIGCTSDEVKFRKVDSNKNTVRVDADREISFCCNDISRVRLTEVLADLGYDELVVARDKGSERISLCMNTTMGVAMREVVGDETAE
jgi:hypothetical protein